MGRSWKDCLMPIGPSVWVLIQVTHWHDIFPFNVLFSSKKHMLFLLLNFHFYFSPPPPPVILLHSSWRYFFYFIYNFSRNHHMPSIMLLYLMCEGSMLTNNRRHASLHGLLTCKWGRYENTKSWHLQAKKCLKHFLCTN